MNWGHLEGSWCFPVAEMWIWAKTFYADKVGFQPPDPRTQPSAMINLHRPRSHPPLPHIWFGLLDRPWPIRDGRHAARPPLRGGLPAGSLPTYRRRASSYARSSSERWFVTLSEVFMCTVIVGRPCDQAGRTCTQFSTRRVLSTSAIRMGTAGPSQQIFPSRVVPYSN